MNPEDYVPYPIALALKKAGFDLKVNHVYDKNGKLWEEGMHKNADCDYTAYFDYNKSGYIEVGASAPTLAQAQKWLREKCGIAINVDAHDGDFYTWEAVFLSNASQIVIEKSLSEKFSPYLEKLDSYEAALSAGIAAVLELIENNKNN